MGIILHKLTTAWLNRPLWSNLRDSSIIMSIKSLTTWIQREAELRSLGFFPLLPQLQKVVIDNVEFLFTKQTWRVWHLHFLWFLTNFSTYTELKLKLKFHTLIWIGWMRQEKAAKSYEKNITIKVSDSSMTKTFLKISNHCVIEQQKSLKLSRNFFQFTKVH